MSVQTHISLAWPQLRRQRRLKLGSLLNDHEIFNWLIPVYARGVRSSPTWIATELPPDLKVVNDLRKSVSLIFPVPVENAREFVKEPTRTGNETICAPRYEIPPTVSRDRHRNLACSVGWVELFMIDVHNWVNVPTVQQKIFVSEKFRQKRPSGSSSRVYFRQTSGRSFCLRSFRSFAYRLSSHSWLFLIPHLSFWGKFSQEFNLVKKLLWRKRRN